MNGSLYDVNWLSSEVGARVIHIRNQALKLFEPSPIEMCEHGEHHCWRIEYAFHHLIPGEKCELLNEKERFFLLTAPWVMNIAWNQSDSLNDDQYHKKASQFLNNPAKRLTLGITDEEAEIFASMIHFHSFSEILDDCPETLAVEDRSIRVRLLTAYLRLADAIHVDSDIKGPKSLFIFLEDPGSPELFHWFKSKLHLTIRPKPDEDTILVNVRNFIPPKEPLIQRVKEELELHVDAVRNSLIQGGVTKYLNVKVEFRPGAELPEEMMHEVVTLLREYALSFPPNAGVLQELYISSIQRIVQQENVNANAKITEIDQVQIIAKASRRFRPCHVAFARLIDEVEGHLRTNDPDAKVRALQRWAGDTQRRFKERLEMVVRNGSSELRKFDRFLLFGFSNTIVETMKESFSDDNGGHHDIEIYVCEAHNKSRFDLIGRLMYVDGINYAGELKKALPNIKVTLIPDVTVADILTLKIKDGRWMALFGANGITPEASCGHTSGHLSLAILARYFDIPVYILCDSYKIGELKSNPELERKEQWIKSVPHWRLGSSQRVELQNLRESVIEPQLISKIVTEHGVFTIPQFLDKYP